MDKRTHRLGEYRKGIRRAQEHYEFYFYAEQHKKAKTVFKDKSAMDIFWAWHEWDLENEPLSRRAMKAYLRGWSSLRWRDMRQALTS